MLCLSAWHYKSWHLTMCTCRCKIIYTYVLAKSTTVSIKVQFLNIRINMHVSYLLAGNVQFNDYTVRIGSILELILSWFLCILLWPDIKVLFELSISWNLWSLLSPVFTAATHLWSENCLCLYSICSQNDFSSNTYGNPCFMLVLSFRDDVCYKIYNHQMIFCDLWTVSDHVLQSLHDCIDQLDPCHLYHIT